MTTGGYHAFPAKIINDTISRARTLLLLGNLVLGLKVTIKAVPGSHTVGKIKPSNAQFPTHELLCKISFGVFVTNYFPVSVFL